MTFVNDYALVGFWPLDEPSGTPFWYNRAPRTAVGANSGISYDFQVCRLFGDDARSARAIWPGHDTAFIAESGTTYRGLRLQGRHEFDGASTAEHYADKYLVVGDGAFPQRRMGIPPDISQSGWTCGMWVLPQSDGWYNYVETNGTGSTLDHTERVSARIHGLMSRMNLNDIGFTMGVSGQMNEGSQFASNKEGAHQLRAFVHSFGGEASQAGGIDSIHIDTPIESGRPTHLTMVFRAEDASADTYSVAFYADGSLAGSGQYIETTDSQKMCVPSTVPAAGHFADCPLVLGANTDETTSTADSHNRSIGWDHLVSGVYWFERPLWLPEVEELHGAGGIQPDEAVHALVGKEKTVPITDNKLLTYVNFQAPSFVDVSRTHLPLLGIQDESCQATNFTSAPGPFNRGGAVSVTNNITASFGTLSGVQTALMQHRSFTICMLASPSTITSYPHDVICGQGPVGSIETSTFFNSAAVFNMGYGSTASVNYPRVRIYEHGSQDLEVELKVNTGGDPWRRVYSHYAFAYDDQTHGVAFYQNGVLMQSGTLPNGSLADHMTRSAGSGYPIYFWGGIQGTTGSSDSPIDFLLNGGLDTAMSEIAIFGRPLEQQEVRFMAVSGIDTTPLSLTVHDPRLRGFWAGTEDVNHIIPDRAAVWQDIPMPAVGSISEFTWQHQLYENGSADRHSAFFETDWFSRTRETPPELASYGNLGMTSGAWSVGGGSTGGQAANVVTVIDRKTSYGNVQTRYKPSFDERDQSSHHFFEEWIISYEVTPSGNIPKAPYTVWNATADPSRNCILHAYHEGANDAHACWLTSIYADNPDPLGQDAAGGSTGPSGVTVVLGGTDGGTTIVNASISGNIAYGVPSRILIHSKSQNPYIQQSATPQDTILSLYIDGEMVSRKSVDTNLAYLWSNNSAGGSSDDWVLDFGGFAVDELRTGAITAREAGFGEIYMRNAFVMKGIFTQAEVDSLAANGIDLAPSIANYTNNQGFATTSVSTAHSDLEAYYRFAGGQSGAIDLSAKDQPPTHLARLIVEDGNGTFGSFTNADNTAFNLRYVPGPLAANDLNVQSSGITFANDRPVTDANSAAPFVVSGVPAMQTPDLGFTICFLYAPRDDNGSSVVRIPISFGGTGDIYNQTLNRDSSWAVVWDTQENMVMHMSVDDGRMHFDPNGTAAERDGSIRCGLYGSKGIEHDEMLNQYKKGAFGAAGLDAWTHYAFSYDPSGSGTMKAYMNGVMLNETPMGGRRLRRPIDPAGRMISFMCPFEFPWDWRAVNNEDEGVLTDFAYFSAPITDEEIRFIAYNGIISPFSTEASGIIGGFSYGQDTGSGIVGSYVRSQDTGSGIMGGFELGSIEMSGIIGGFSSGVIVTTGLVGGYFQSLDTGSGLLGGMIFGAEITSGIFGGYLQSQDLGSGFFGGHTFGAFAGSGLMGGMSFGSIALSGLFGGITIGGLAGGEDFDAYYVVKAVARQDFDAQLEATTTLSANFDAAATVFQEEAPPLVEIIIPGQTVEGLVPPFNQYFIGKASGTQDKTITKTTWNFGDFTPTVTTAESGAGCYPVQHHFAASGFYVVRFTAIDSDGVHNSATRYVNAASGIPEALISLSGVPQIGEAALNVAFATQVEALPPGVSITSKLLTFDDGQTTTSLSPVHSYTEPGVYRPVWCIRDSRGFIWCDSLDPGIDFLK
jgi:hypothetical protein